MHIFRKELLKKNLCTQHASHVVSTMIRANKSRSKFSQQNHIKLSRLVMTVTVEDACQDLEESKLQAGEAVQEILLTARTFPQETFMEFKRTFFDLITSHRELLWMTIKEKNKRAMKFKVQKIKLVQNSVSSTVSLFSFL